MIQGGEITKHDGTGGVSIYGDYFDGAWISLPLPRPGVVHAW